MTTAYENLPKLVKVIVQIFLGYPISGVYRLLRFFENKKILTLIAAILAFFGAGIVFWIADLITEIVRNEIILFAD